MGIARGPNIITEDLVFGYDTGYGIANNDTATRFYPGAPAVNLNTDPYHSTKSAGDTVTLSVWAGDTGQGSFEVNTSPDGGGMMFIINNTSTAAGGGGAYTDFPTTRYTLTNGVTYTRSWWCKSNINQTLSGHICSCNRDSDNLYIVGSNISLTAEWQRFSETFTYTGSTSTDWQFRHINYNNSIVYIANVQLEANGFASPSVNGTRSNTDSLIDLKRTTDIDISNVSFDSTGQPEFDGTDDIINTGLFSGRNPKNHPFTIEAIVKSDTTSGNHMWIDATGNGTNQRLYCAHASTGSSTPLGIQNSGWSHSIPQDTNYHHYVITMNGSTAQLYNNNVAHSSKSYTSYTLSGQINVGGRSGYRWVGKIPVFKIYDKVLNTTEIEKNYKTYKNRFNL